MFEIVIGIGERPVEVAALVAAVALGAPNEPPLELVGGATLRAHQAINARVIDASFFAFAHLRCPHGRTHFDLAVESADAIGAAAIVVDCVDRLIGCNVACARGIESQRFAIEICALHDDVSVAQFDDCLRRAVVVGIVDGSEADRGGSIERDDVAVGEPDLGAAAAVRRDLIARKHRIVDAGLGLLPIVTLPNDCAAVVVREVRLLAALRRVEREGKCERGKNGER